MVFAYPAYRVAGGNHGERSLSSLKLGITACVSPTGFERKESVLAELTRLEEQYGLTLASFYRGIEIVSFRNRSVIQGKDLQFAYEGTVSRDGTEVAASLGPFLGIAALDGSHVRKYPDTAAVEECWSYNKSKLLVTAENVQGGASPPNYSLEILSLDSNSTQQVDVRAQVTSQCWSPDDKQVVYEADDTVRLYDTERKLWSVLAKGRAPTWSPDGKWIAFLDNDTYYAIRPSGEDRKVMFHKWHAVSGLYWSPDSRIVAYASQAGLLEGVITFDVEEYRLRVRRLADNSEDWVVSVGLAAGSWSWQWVTNKELIANLQSNVTTR